MKKILLLALCALALLPLGARKTYSPASDRAFWASTMYRMAHPVLSALAQGELRRKMPLEKSPSYDNRNPNVGYLECFGRLMDGLAPWLALPDDATPEGLRRKELRTLALTALPQAVNPTGPDYMHWRSEAQPLVDAAFLAQGLLRAYDALWLPLDTLTKSRYIEEFTRLRRVKPFNNNWVLFASTIEAFLLRAGAPVDTARLMSGLEKTEKWYIGDGWYGDGPSLHFDYYNSFVIQPMYVDCLRELVPRGMDSEATLSRALRRMQRYAVILERLISPEGTFPAFGRSIVYRSGCLQPLPMLALLHKLPAELPPAQVRAALTAVYRKMFTGNQNFNADGYLILGFNGSQGDICDSYVNSGSCYLASFGFTALGLPATDAFWTQEARPWTQVKAWGGEEFPKDHAW